MAFPPLCLPDLWAYYDHNPKDKHVGTVCLFPIHHQTVSFLRLDLIPSASPACFPGLGT